MLGENLSKRELENKLKEADIIIFDMDGTLYELDGQNKSYRGSSLETAVLTNVVKLISEEDHFSEEDSHKLIENINSQNLFLSIYLGEKYGLTREQYFNIVWDIDPEGKIQNYTCVHEIIAKLHDRGKKLILLTSAPFIWQQKVLEYLEITDYFSIVYTGEQFIQKEEIFTVIREEYPGLKILSIGDQLDTDITPALNTGIDAYLVTGPSELIRSVNL